MTKLSTSLSHTLDGFYIASAGVAPDMMFVKTLPPFDFPDFYDPGYICKPNGFD